MNDQERPETYEVTRDSVLYLIDASTSMEKSNTLTVALSSASWAIREAAREGGSRTDAGVILYNLSANDGSSKLPAVVLLSLHQPKIDDLKHLIRLSRDVDTFRTSFAPLEPNGKALISALRIANSELNHLHTRSLRRVVIITNDDDPIKKEDIHQSTIAANLMSDLTGSPAFVMPIFVKTPRFDIRKFWMNLTYVPPPMLALSANQPHQADDLYSNPKLLEPWDLETLANPKKALVLSKSRRKYVTFKGAIVFGELNIGIRGYSVVRGYQRAQALKVAHATNEKGLKFQELLVSERILAYSDTGSDVKANGENDEQISRDTSRRFKIGSSIKNEEDWTVPVSEEQLQKLTTSVLPNETIPRHPVVYVHSFVNSCEINLPGCLTHSVFITPGNDLFSNSWSAFASLRQTMRRRRVVAMVSFYPAKTSHRSNSPLSGLLYAFNPNCGSGSIDDSKDAEPNTASGMYLVHTPYQDDLREIPKDVYDLSIDNIDTDAEGSIDLKDNIRTLCNKFSMHSAYLPNRFASALTKQFAEILEHHALNLPLDAEALEKKDDTKPRYTKILKTSALTAHNIQRDLRLSAPADAMLNIKPERLAKRKKDESLTDGDFIKAFKTNTLSQFTVAQLKDAIAQFEPPKARLKAGLVEQLSGLIDSSTPK